MQDFTVAQVNTRGGKNGYIVFLVTTFNLSTLPHGRSLDIPRGKGVLKSQTFRKKV